jgi:VanZ family protein
MSLRNFVSRWVPAIAWMILIFAGSTDALSAEQTSRFIVPFLLWLDPHMSWATVREIHFALRKMGHLTEYAILAALLWRALRTMSPSTGWRLAGITLLIAGTYAALDEFHQSFAVSRTASPNDVMIDICGAIFGLLICWAWSSRRGRKKVRLSAGKVIETQS